MATHPFPQLNVHPLSGLSFAWSESIGPNVQAVWSASFGPEGVGEGMVIYVAWSDLPKALQELLGYSYRISHGNDTPPTVSVLRRVLPWQSPQWNQMYVQKVSQVRGLTFAGKTNTAGFGGGGAGAAGKINLGPHSTYEFAEITVQFHRPLYFVLSDKAIIVDGKPREWLRYTEKNWNPDIQILSREGSVFTFTAGQGTPPTDSPFPGTVGQKIMRYGVSRKWHQIPEAAIFELDSDQQPNGRPTNICYTQTNTTNPITGIPYTAYDNSVIKQHVSPIGGCVNSPIGGGIVDTESLRFLGAPMGTLLYKAVKITPTPLQLPPALMQIPIIANNTALSQVQYDIEFFFDYFDPVRDSTIYNSDAVTASGARLRDAIRGHNLMPWSGNGRWYAVNAKVVVDGGLFKATPFDYADFSDLFQIL